MVAASCNEMLMLYLHSARQALEITENIATIVQSDCSVNLPVRTLENAIVLSSVLGTLLQPVPMIVHE